MPAAFALHPFPRNCPLGGFSFFSLLQRELCPVNHWQRKGRNPAQLRPPASPPARQPASQPASRFPSGSYQWSPPSCSKQPPRIVSLPQLPSTTRVSCCPHARRHPPGHEHTPCCSHNQTTEGTPQRPHFSCRDRKKLINPLMHSQVKKNSKETHVAARVPVQLWRRGSVLA